MLGTPTFSVGRLLDVGVAAVALGPGWQKEGRVEATGVSLWGG